MASIQATRLKKGMLVKLENDLYRVLDLQHGRLHEVADPVVGDAADEDVDQPLVADPLEQLAVLGERP